MADRLHAVGKFLTHRNIAGAAAADSSVINDANFPTSSGFDSWNWETILLYFTGTGEDLAVHELVLEPLYRDATNSVWTRGARFALKARQLAEFPTNGAPLVSVRIESVTGAGLSAVQIRCSGGLGARRA